MAGLYGSYAQVIMQHYRQSRFRGVIDTADYTITLSNPLCGDQITATAKISSSGSTSSYGDKNVIAAKKIIIRFEARGCVLSQAMASIFLEHIEHMSMQEIQAISRADFLAFVNKVLAPTQGAHSSAEVGEFLVGEEIVGTEKKSAGDIVSSMAIGPTRQRCVLLIFDAVQSIVEQIQVTQK
jgi:NifU-like protein involved in Fe-S cluster formation